LIFSAKTEIMAREIDLLTRGSGHLGFCALVGALEAGYHVHAVVQTQIKADLILAAPSINAVKPGPRLESIIVSDILADGADDKAVKGVNYIVHAASPIAFQRTVTSATSSNPQSRAQLVLPSLPLRLHQ